MTGSPASPWLLCPLRFEAGVLSRTRRRRGLPPLDPACCGPGGDAVRRWLDRAAETSCRDGRGVILVGTAGGLDPSLASGTAARIGEVVAPDGRRWSPTLELDQPRRAIRATSVEGIASPEEKRTLRGSTGADAVDLESVAFAEACDARAIPWAIVRGISDAAEEALPVDAGRWIDASGRTRPHAVLASILRRPSLLGTLRRLSRTSRAALEDASNLRLATTRRWIVFGGSFDPPHRGHVELPRRAARALAAERVLYVPANLNPLKESSPPTPASHRLAMLRLALAGDDLAEIRTIEIDRGGASYAADTMEALAEEAARATPPARLVLLLGADAALSLPRWRDPARIAATCELAVMLRPPHDRASFARSFAAAWGGSPPAIVPRWVLDLGRIEASSTAVREGAPRDDLSPAVADYARTHRLYQASGGRGTGACQPPPE